MLKFQTKVRSGAASGYGFLTQMFAKPTNCTVQSLFAFQFHMQKQRCFTATGGSHSLGLSREYLCILSTRLPLIYRRCRIS